MTQPHLQPSPEQEKSLAERCYEQGRADEELFHKIHYILGGAPLKECTKPGFIWPCLDCWTDHYDCSVEIALTENCPEFTQEHANAILDFGFGQIYVSRAGKEGPQDGENWGRSGKSWCSPRERSDERPQLIKARAENATFRSANAEMERRLAMAEDAANKGDDARTRMGAMESLLAEMEGWKQSALAVMPDFQEIGRLIEARLGSAVHEQIVPAIKALKAQNLTLAAALKQAREALEYYKGAPWVENKSGIWYNSNYFEVAEKALAAPADLGMVERIVSYLKDVAACEPEHYDASCQCVTCGAKRLLTDLGGQPNR